MGTFGCRLSLNPFFQFLKPFCHSIDCSSLISDDFFHPTFIIWLLSRCLIDYHFPFIQH